MARRKEMLLDSVSVREISTEHGRPRTRINVDLSRIFDNATFVAPTGERLTNLVEEIRKAHKFATGKKRSEQYK